MLSFCREIYLVRQQASLLSTIPTIVSSEAIDEATNLMIQLQFEHKADDLLVVQTKLFIESVLNM